MLIRQIFAFTSACLIFAAPSFSQEFEVFVADSGNSSIYKVSTENTHVRQLIKADLGSVGGIAINPANGDIYYTINSISPSGGIKRINSDGSNETDVATNLNFPTAIAFNPSSEELFFIQLNLNSDPSIFKVHISGSPAPQELITGIPSAGPIDIAIDSSGGFIYWTDGRGSSIRRASVTGLGEQILVSPITGIISGITFDGVNNRVYWIDETDTDINYIDTNGTTFPTAPLTAVDSNLIGSGGLTVDNDRSPPQLYWTNSAGSVSTALFGGSAINLLEAADGGVSAPIDLEIKPLPTPTPTPTPTPVSTELTPGTTLTTAPSTTVNNRSVRLILRQFTTVVSESAILDFLAPLRARAKAKAMTIRYDVKITAAKKKDSRRLLSKRNELTVKNLKPGNYSVNYSAVAYQKKSKKQIEKALDRGKTGFTAKFKKVFSTNFSPSAGFTIQ